jgi:putative redox protein
MKCILHRTDDAQHTVVTDEYGNPITMYLPADAGGAGTGIRPMQMLILGLAGCSAVDVLMILKKQRQQVTDFTIEIEAFREPDKEPSLWQNAHLIFKITGTVDPVKAQKAVELSMHKYCSVAETLRLAGANLTWEIIVQ